MAFNLLTTMAAKPFMRFHDVTSDNVISKKTLSESDFTAITFGLVAFDISASGWRCMGATQYQLLTISVLDSTEMAANGSS